MRRGLGAMFALALGAGGGCTVLTDLDGLRGGAVVDGGGTDATTDVVAPLEGGAADGGADGGGDAPGTDADGGAPVPFCAPFTSAIVCSDFEEAPLEKGFLTKQLTGNGVAERSSARAAHGTTSFKSTVPGGLANAGAELLVGVPTAPDGLGVTFDLFLDGAPSNEIEIASYQSKDHEAVVTVRADRAVLCSVDQGQAPFCTVAQAIPVGRWVRVELGVAGLQTPTPTAKLLVDGVTFADVSMPARTVVSPIVAIGYWTNSNASGTAYYDGVVIEAR